MRIDSLGPIRFTAIAIAVCLVLQTGRQGSLAQSVDKSKMQLINPAMPGPLPIDPNRVRANGIRVIRGQHIDIYTDIRDQPEIDELPKLFDAAISGWCNYFGIEVERTRHFHLNGFLFTESKKDAFRSAGLMPDDLPSFPAGFNRGHELWVILQQDIYYTRHLILHEGTHAFMQWFLGSSGPPWYSEGMAELMAVHRWNDDQLTIGHLVRDRADARGWGRVKILREQFGNGASRSLDQVTSIANAEFRLPRPIGYSWAWAACEFLSKHPLTRKPFSKLSSLLNGPAEPFNRQLRQMLAQYRDQLDVDWELFCGEMEYGIEIERGAVTTAAADSNGGYRIDSTRSWQKTGLRVEAGDWLKIAASGRFTVSNQDGEVWPCEAGGITIDYYRGKPLGSLMMGIWSQESGANYLLNPIRVGLATEVQVPASGTVCLRINESPAKLYDNEGGLSVSIQKQ